MRIKRLDHTTDEGNVERLMQDIAKFQRYVTIKSAKIVDSAN